MNSMDKTHCVSRRHSGHLIQEENRAGSVEENRALIIRLAHACIALGLVATLLLALWLKPDPRGIGTHEQLLLYPCNFHSQTGLPCPFCGMTTAFTHMAHGNVRQALMTQPLGALGFVVVLFLTPVAVGAAITGRNAIGAAMKMPWGKLTWMFALIVVGAWIFKLVMTLTA